MFTNNVTKKQSNISITRYYERNYLAISFHMSGDVMCQLKTFIIFVCSSKETTGSK